jgi:RNA polymerase sigma-70 factor, ECF subfamily
MTQVRRIRRATPEAYKAGSRDPTVLASVRSFGPPCTGGPFLWEGARLSQDKQRLRDDADDLRAVQETLRGDLRAFDRLVDRYTPLLYSLAMRYLDGPEAAEDAVQEVFLRAYDALDRFQISRRFYSWIYTIAVNYLRNARGKRRRRGVDKNLPYEDGVNPGWDRPPLADPERELRRQEDQAMVQRALTLMKPKYRDVIILYQLEERPVAEVAEVLGLPEGTVKTHLHRARKQLAELIAEMDVTRSEHPSTRETDRCG